MAKTKELEVVDKDLVQIEEIKKGVGDLNIRMSAIKIKTEADYSQALEIGKEGAKSVKKLKLAIELAGSPYKRQLEKIKGAGNAIIDAIETGMDDLRDRCKKFIRDEEEKRRKEADALRLKQQKEQEALANADTAKEQIKIEKKIEQTQTKIETVQATKTENSLTFRKVVVVDESLVPREFLSVDMTKLNAVKGKVGTPLPVIAGVNIFDDKQVKFG